MPQSSFKMPLNICFEWDKIKHRFHDNQFKQTDNSLTVQLQVIFQLKQAYINLHDYHYYLQTTLIYSFSN
jgi:Neuraminidase (sialidase)